MHESPRRSNHLQRRLPKGEDRLKSAKHQGTNQPKRCGTEFNRQPQKRLRCVHNLGIMLVPSRFLPLTALNPTAAHHCASLPSWSGRMIDMKEFFASLFLSGVLCLSAFGAPLSSNARTVVPSAVQQMISVDYRALRDSATAHALKDRVLPDSLKQFEKALKGAGIDPEKDVEQLTLVNYRSQKGPRSIGIAQGPFKKAEFLQKMRAKKVHPEKYQLSYLYPMG